MLAGHPTWQSEMNTLLAACCCCVLVPLALGHEGHLSTGPTHLQQCLEGDVVHCVKVLAALGSGLSSSLGGGGSSRDTHRDTALAYDVQMCSV